MKFIITILILTSSLILFSQNNNKIFSYGTANADQSKVIVPSKGGSLVLGETIIESKKSILLYKKNNTEAITWSKTISAEHPLVINDALKTTNGYILAAENYVNNRESLLLIDIDENGESNWVNTFNEEGNEVEPYAIESSPTAYYIGGFTKLATLAVNSFYNYSIENQFPYLLKTDKNGKKIWAKQLVLNNNKIAGDIRDIALTKNNNIIIIANIYNPNSKSKSISNYLIKLNEQGIILWSKSIANSKIEFMKIKLSRNGEMFLVGKKFISEKNRNVVVTKLNNKGQTIWAKSYGGNDVDIPIDLELNNNKIFVSTSSNSFDTKKRSQALLLILENKGNLITHKYIDGLNFSKISSIKSKNDEIIFSGSIINFSKQIIMNTISGNINDLETSNKINLSSSNITLMFLNSVISITEVNGEVNPNNLIGDYKIKVENIKITKQKL